MVVGEWVGGWMDSLVDVCTDGWINSLMHDCMDGPHV